jgi:hypothetical protein
LFGTKQYGAGVDVWAAACIFAELLLRRPFLQVNLNFHGYWFLQVVIRCFGTCKFDFHVFDVFVFVLISLWFSFISFSMAWGSTNDILKARLG